MMMSNCKSLEIINENPQDGYRTTVLVDGKWYLEFKELSVRIAIDEIVTLTGTLVPPYIREKSEVDKQRERSNK